MRRATKVTVKVSATSSAGKKTSIGRGNVSFSTMPKRKKQTYKKYRGQGK
jgi:hypothetical protein